MHILVYNIYMATSFQRKFWHIVHACVHARMCVLFPLPPKEEYVVNLRNMRVSEATTAPEDTMAVQVANIEISGDAIGYNVSGIVATNKAGHPRDPQPADDQWEGGTNDETGVTNIRRLADGTWFISVDDSRVPGDVVLLTVSSDPDVDGDDAVIHATYVADRPGPVDVGGMQIVEATEAPSA